MTRVAVLIVSYRSADEVAGLVASLDGAAGPDVNLRAYAIENHPDPGAAAELRAVAGLDAVVENPANSGYGGGVNRLVAALPEPADWYLVSNPDVRYGPGSITELLAAAEENPGSALFGPLIEDDDGRIYPSARAFPSLRTGVGHALFGNLWPDNPWTRRYRQHDTAATRVRTTVDWLSGACLLVRPDAFAAIDGFDEAFFMYFEDVDLAWRLNKVGWSSTWVPTAHVVHSGAHSTRQVASRMRRAHHDSARLYLNRRYAAPWLLPVRWALTAALAVRARLGRRGPTDQ